MCTWHVCVRVCVCESGVVTSPSSSCRTGLNSSLASVIPRDGSESDDDFSEVSLTY